MTDQNTPTLVQTITTEDAIRGHTIRRSGAFRCAGRRSGDQIPHRARWYAGPYGWINASPFSVVIRCCYE